MQYDYSIKGTAITPKIYFIEDVNQNTNMSFSGNFILSIFNAYGITESNCRFFSLSRENIDSEELLRIIEDIKADIVKCKPKVIVTVGSSASTDILDKEFKKITTDHGKVFPVRLSDCETYVIPVYHPGYMNRQDAGSMARVEFKSDLKKACDIAFNGIFPKERETVSYNDNTVICLNYEEFDRFCREEIDNSDVVAYDIETNAEEKTSSRYEVVGFSLSSRSNMGCYVVLNSLDYTMPVRDNKLVQARLRKVLLNKKSVLVYNCMHEVLATLNWLRIDISDTVYDLFVVVKLLMGNADKYEGNGGLKIQCSMNLGIDDWSADLDLYFKLFKSLDKSTDSIKKLLLNYYSEHEFGSLLELLNAAYNNPDNFNNKVISYGLVPYKLIGKYGGTDSSVLFDLKRYYDDLINKYNTELGIDLNKGYSYWMKHHKSGYIMERNGAYWNDEKADELEKWCQDGMVNTLNYLICSPLSEPYVRSSLENSFYIYLMNNHLEDILQGCAVPKRLYKSSVTVELIDDKVMGCINPLRSELARMSLLPETKKNKKLGIEEVTNKYKLELGNIKTLSKTYLNYNPNIYTDWYKQYMEDYKNSEHKDLKEMRKMLNPTATNKAFKDFVTDMLVTDDIRYAKFYNNIVAVLENPEFNIEHYSNDYYENDRKLFELVLKLQSSDYSSSKKFSIFNKFVNNSKVFKSRTVNDCIDKALAFRLDSFQEDIILELYDLFCMCGLDIEDKSTWTDRFEWLYNFRFYKKYSKLVSTYIDGKVGRSSVWYVDKESLSNGDKFTKREFKYDEVDKNETDLSDKTTLLQSDFMVNMADSGRWKAGLHTVPAGETVKGIYTSRFKGGVIAMPDCSQAEVRVLAAQAQDKNLINAFMKDGMDIHKFVASLVFHQGDIEAVTKTERKIAKSAVFGILYGESEKTFADTFFHGDIKEAEKIFEYFYTAFPGIKEYVEESHRQVDKFKKVILPITDRFINMEQIALKNGNDTDKVYRQAQNMIIQGETCDVAGLILYRVCNFIEENNLKSKVFCYIHDSIELDCHPNETFLLLDKLKPLFNQYPYDRFGIPMASDMVFSANMGAEIEIVEMLHDDEYNDVTITMKGFRDNIDEVIGLWKEVYDLVEEDTTYESEEPKPEYVPLGGLFQKKVVISKFMGTTRYKISVRYHVVRHLS